MTSRVTARVAEFCRKQALIQQGDKIVIGVSGGPDSLCLLHLLINNLQAELALKLTIAHLNHQLRGVEAEADAAYVRDQAARWRVPLREKTSPVAVLAAQRKQSLEETARQVRYAFLWQVAAEVGAAKIAVGHNADDQVETVLMHFLRGTGLAGLRGMLPKVDIADLRLHPADQPARTATAPQLIRPLLEISRQEIEAYCQEHSLTPRQDYSNQDTTLFRNRLRHELLPYLENYNPNIRQVLQHTAQVVTADSEILEEQLRRNWDSVVKSESPQKIEFDLPQWLALPLALKRSTLRRAIQNLRRSLRDVNFEHIENAIAIVEQGGTGAKATLPQGLILTVSYDCFTIGPEHTPPELSRFDWPYLATNQRLPLNLPGVTALPHSNWQLKATLQSKVDPSRLNQVGDWEAYLDADIVGEVAILRPRQPGDIFYPLGLAGRRQKINEYMINQKIPAEQRHFIPLLVAQHEVLWVCGYRPDERARIWPDTQRVLHLKFELK